jgi:hypothetical protein
MIDNKRASEDREYRKKARNRADFAIVLPILGIAAIVIYSYATGEVDEAIQGLKVAGVFVGIILAGLIAMSGFSVIPRLLSQLGPAIKSVAIKIMKLTKR